MKPVERTLFYLKLKVEKKVAIPVHKATKTFGCKHKFIIVIYWRQMQEHNAEERKDRVHKCQHKVIQRNTLFSDIILWIGLKDTTASSVWVDYLALLLPHHHQNFNYFNIVGPSILPPSGLHVINTTASTTAFPPASRLGSSGINGTRCCDRFRSPYLLWLKNFAVPFLPLDQLEFNVCATY